MKPATTKGLWAPIVKPKRGAEWIIPGCIQFTKKGSIESFLKGIPEKLHESRLKNVRFARVQISEVTNPSHETRST